MPLLKLTRGIQLEKIHPLARGLVGYWLMNEGTGNKVFDLSGNGKNGVISGDVTWGAGNYGSTLNFGGTNSNVKTPNVIDFGTGDFSICSRVKFSTDITNWRHLFANRDDWDSNFVRILLSKDSEGDAGQMRFYTEAAAGITNNHGIDCETTVTLNDNVWHDIVCTRVGAVGKIYIDGILNVTGTVEAGDLGSTDFFWFGDNGTGGGLLIGGLEYFSLYNRALFASEIALLYREPFCMFERAGRPELIGGQTVNLAGTSAALSFLSATAKTIRKVGGSLTSTSDVTALLNLICSLPDIERIWLREALFNGMTANAFKLGTNLSLGWFWVRVAGCSVLYRGSSMQEIDFKNTLVVSEQDACEISPPSYISHNSDSTYFYLIRRFNSCGCQERTLAAAVKVSIESSGDLAEPGPNNISSSKAKQVHSNKIRLAWFYCPLEQKSQPVSFNVYYDDRTGQIDYQNPLATIGYKGRKFYSFQSDELDSGRYLFAIRAEGSEGIENSSLAQLKIQLNTTSPDAINILSAEAV